MRSVKKKKKWDAWTQEDEANTEIVKWVQKTWATNAWDWGGPKSALKVLFITRTLNKKVAIKCKAVQTHWELPTNIWSQISKAFIQVTYLLFASSVIGTSMVLWVLTNSEWGFISGYNKITLKLNKKKSNSETPVRNTQKKTFKGEYL